MQKRCCRQPPILVLLSAGLRAGAVRTGTLCPHCEPRLPAHPEGAIMATPFSANRMRKVVRSSPASCAA
jgi:hypothetical protein